MSLVTLRHLMRRETSHASPERRALFAAQALLFITLAIPILLDKESITIAWALEVLGLVWLKRRVQHHGLVIFAGLLAIAVATRLLVNPALWHYHPRSSLPILNFYRYTFGIPAVSFLLAAALVRTDEDALRWKLPGVLNLAAAVFVFFLLNIEIADWYSEGSTIEFRLSGGSLAEDMTYSLAWGCFGLVLLLLGIVRRRRAVRIGALAVVTLTIGKVFLHDLWALGSLYRVGSIVGLAVALLIVSFLTQRFLLTTETDSQAS
jgi:uncharacterized membrane protein